MLKKLKCLMAGLLFSGLASYAQEVKFIGTADKKYDGSKVVLYNHITSDHDSAVLKEGKFSITVDFKEPTVYMFYSEYEMKKKGGYSPYGIMITEPGTIKMETNLESFSETRVSGAKENELYTNFSKKVMKHKRKLWMI